MTWSDLWIICFKNTRMMLLHLTVSRSGWITRYRSVFFCSFFLTDLAYIKAHLLKQEIDRKALQDHDGSADLTQLQAAAEKIWNCIVYVFGYARVRQCLRALLPPVSDPPSRSCGYARGLDSKDSSSQGGRKNPIPLSQRGSSSCRESGRKESDPRKVMSEV